jgi:hypothetical protein
MAYPVALIVVAVGRKDGVGPLGVPLFILLIFLQACAVGMLVFRGRVLDGPWLGGLPMAAAIQLYGLFFGPLLLVALVYALTFDRFELTEEALEHLEEFRVSGSELRVDSPRNDDEKPGTRNPEPGT